MVNKVLKLFVTCLCFTAVYCNVWDPWVWPETFVDDGKPFIEFTCGAYLKSEDWLSWYKGPDQETLTTIKQQNEGNMTITLLWPLALLKNYEVYCSKENESYWDGGNEYWKKKTDSKPIAINFLREIEPININNESGPWVTPAKFEDNGKQVIEFTCYAYLTKEKILSWYQIKEKSVSKLEMIQQTANYGYKKITLQKTLWPFDNGSQIYCDKEGKEVKEEEKIFLTFDRYIEPLGNIWDPRVWPDSFVDDGNPFIEFTCAAYLKSEDWLSWYKGSDLETLTTIKQQNEGNITITLLWPLALLKNDEVYCSKENESYWEGGKEYWKKKTDSKPIPINFLREVETINIDIESGTWVTPAKFVDNGKQVIEFSCYAYLTKEKTLSWYQIKGKRISKLGMIQQKADYGYKKITLQKTLWPCDNGSQIYCEKEGKEVKEDEKILITFDRYIEPLDNVWDPRVWPETFVDDGNPFIEFTCGAYLKSEDWLSWYRGSDLKTITTIQQHNEGNKINKLLWPLALLKNDEVYCSKENESYWEGGKEYWKKKTDSKPIPINFLREVEPINIDIESGPWVTPAKFVDNGKQVIEFTCYAYLTEEETLSWYQVKDKSVSKLGIIQQEAYYGYTKITLHKTLESSDNGSQIYCEMEGGEVEQEDKILITFHRDIEALETPYVTVEPSADAAFFDEGDKLEFVCSGSKAVDGRAFTWYLQTPGFNQVVPPDQHFSKTTNQNSLTLPMGVFDHGKILYCAQDLTFSPLAYGAVSTIMSYGELARSRTITLLHRGQCNKTDQPRMTPDTFEDDQKPFVQFTCYAFLESGQLLSWYQSTGLSKLATLLRLVQFQDPRAKKGEWVVVTLNKTLEPGDNGSEIYCARQTVLPDGSFSNVSSVSERSPLTLHRDIPPLVNAFITVEPNTTEILFEVNTTLRLTCSGSKPVDGRNFTWLRKDSDSRLTMLEGQKYDQTTNLNVLEMSLSETHHLNRIVCALGFLSYIRLNDGSSRLKMYGELTEPKTITLILREKSSEEKEITSHNDTTSHNDPKSHNDPESHNDTKSHNDTAENQTMSHICLDTYGIFGAILLAVTALVASAVTCCVLRKSWTAPPSPPAPTAPADDDEQCANVPREMASPR